MKILLVAMPSLHFYRWSEQLQAAGHELYWFNITDGGAAVSRIDFMRQKYGWKLKWDYPGRTFVKAKFPKLYTFLQKFNENNTTQVFENYVNEVQPDVVHSFALYVSCTPILPVMEKFPKLKWIFSSWGSDLYYFQNIPAYLTDIKRVLPRVNYLFTDCYRDYHIAKSYGFQGEFLGVFPGGGGFDLEKIRQYKQPIEQRKTIAIKGFQGRSGRAIEVLKAIILVKEEVKDYEIVVFGSDKEVFDFANQNGLPTWKNFSIQGKLPHAAVLEIFGKSLFYIGNSNSDGMPNTLLEAICCEVFPIQSNPGNVTAEIINDGVNGFLISNEEDISEIARTIKKALSLPTEKIISGVQTYQTKIHNLDFYKVKEQVIACYKKLE